MLVPKIYAEWMKRNQHFETITGSQIFENENSREPNQRELLQASNKAHNEYVKRYNIAFDFIISEDYSGLDVHHTQERKKALVTKTTIR